MQTSLFPQLDDAPLASCQSGWFKQILRSLDVNNQHAWPDQFGQKLRHHLTQHQQRKIPTLSLFSGGGGLDIAFRDAGFDIIEMVEIDQRFTATLAENTQAERKLGGATVRCIDICHYTPPPNLKVEFIIGGPPCQTFSAAGRRAAGVSGTTDPRGTLFAEYVRLLETLQPRGFLFENVYGITGAQDGTAWQAIQQAFRQAGYTIHWRVLDAADYGVPQHRERLFIVGVKDNTHPYQFPYPTHGPDSITPFPYYTAAQAVQNAPSASNDNLNINGRWGHLIEGIPPGLNYSFYTKEMGHPNPVFAWRSKFSDFMYKADPDSPVRTIKAQGGLYTGPFSWENRHFSVEEIKRLQTFPDDYDIVGKRQIQLHQIGNSVPPQIGRMLALSILHQLFDAELPFPMYYLKKDHALGFRTRKRELTKAYANKAQQAIKKLTDNTNTNTFLKEALPLHETAYLTEKFALLKQPSKAITFAVNLSYEQHGDTLVVQCEPAHHQKNVTDTCYEIQMQPRNTQPWAIALTNVTLKGKGLSRQTFTALWKAFEGRIANQFGIDDLVQLSGYYQYSPKMIATLHIDAKLASLPTEWQILPKIVAGLGVAAQIRATTLAELWGIKVEKLLLILHHLRSMGYEVRNHNTNPQIPPGEYLIPYAFPTLTPRSVQLNKSL
ncbi:MAG: DNA (cytosine-5-)-methyltransferase [Thiothrix lacustris]|uniref:Cytosine-specific methyltransferase n=1 Tax=Thiothrix lacustris TaxID=525917 RepID=A0A1Y1QUV5_9GAMM|nr:MAG: DNA (cytosine-5-)-methyltransferase [Thiothrix lacustris]